MFEEIILNEVEETNEAEFHGGPEAGSLIKFTRLLDWMNNVKGSAKAQYLKCLVNKALKVKVYNISDITFSENVMHKDVAYETGVKIAFKEDDGSPAMTIAQAAELFDKIAALCAQNGKDLSKTEVFTEDENGKLSRFAWFYDDETDTAVIVRNMSTADARKFMKAGADTIVRKLAKTPVNPEKLIDELAALEEKIKTLTTRRDSVLDKLDATKDVAAE